MALEHPVHEGAERHGHGHHGAEEEEDLDPAVGGHGVP
jgi:hypothetical protein